MTERIKSNITTTEDMSGSIKSWCDHEHTLNYEGVNICSVCATYLPKQGSPAFKENFLCGHIDLSPYQLYLNMLLEQNRSKVSNTEAPYINSRKPLVDWVYEIGDKLKLSNQTIHIGIFYMDYCLSTGDYPKGKYQLVALTSLIIAAKYDELDSNIPMIKEFIRGSKTVFREEVVKECECALLRLLDWNLRVITPLNFVTLFLGVGVAFPSDTLKGKPLTNASLHSLRKHAEFFADLSLQNQDMLGYDSSVIAISCILAARKCLKITPLWNQAFDILWKSSYSVVEKPFNDLYHYYETIFHIAEDTEYQITQTFPGPVPSKTELEPSKPISKTSEEGENMNIVPSSSGVPRITINGSSESVKVLEANQNVTNHSENYRVEEERISRLSQAYPIKERGESQRISSKPTHIQKPSNSITTTTTTTTTKSNNNRMNSTVVMNAQRQIMGGLGIPKCSQRSRESTTMCSSSASGAIQQNISQSHPTSLSTSIDYIAPGHYNLQDHKRQLEQMKISINNKLISLNKKSRSMETLLQSEFLNGFKSFTGDNNNNKGNITSTNANSQYSNIYSGEGSKAAFTSNPTPSATTTTTTGINHPRHGGLYGYPENSINNTSSTGGTLVPKQHTHNNSGKSDVWGSRMSYGSVQPVKRSQMQVLKFGGRSKEKENTAYLRRYSGAEMRNGGGGGHHLHAPHSSHSHVAGSRTTRTGNYLKPLGKFDIPPKKSMRI